MSPLYLSTSSAVLGRRHIAPYRHRSPLPELFLPAVVADHWGECPQGCERQRKEGEGQRGRVREKRRGRVREGERMRKGWKTESAGARKGMREGTKGRRRQEGWGMKRCFGV
jgi:hypothetical protein